MRSGAHVLARSAVFPAAWRPRLRRWSDESSETAATSHLRYQGYAEALRESGLPVEAELAPEVAVFHRPEGAAAMERLLDLPEPPDAVFCFNDLLALGAMRALHSHGIAIPRQVAVVGFDDIEEGRYSMPTLTTISPDKREIAELAVAALVGQINGVAQPTKERPASFSLVARESTIG